MIKTTPENSIMTGEFRADVLRCSVELAKEPLWEVLKYIQTNIGIDGVTVHPGIVLNFRRNACMEEIMTCVVPADTSEDTLDNVIEAIEKRLENMKKSMGIATVFPILTQFMILLKKRTFVLKAYQ